MAEWTFVTNHGSVLALVAERGRTTAREIALALGITERSVHRIISDLEEAGYIERKRDGRVNYYRVNEELPMRRPEIQHVLVRDWIDLLKHADGATQALTPGKMKAGAR
ncbi:MAG: MarR family transcriptional regulator [SAR202 cluster bacterium]|nr:MarR family transcriptional regulator [SAR202 cluster bacterium]